MFLIESIATLVEEKSILASFDDLYHKYWNSQLYLVKNEFDYRQFRELFSSLRSWNACMDRLNRLRWNGPAERLKPA